MLERLSRLIAQIPGTQWLVRLVARVPATIHAKLLIAFLVMVVLLIAVGAVGVQALAEVSRRAEEMAKLQRKVGAYRQLQHDATEILYDAADLVYGVASGIVVPRDPVLEETLQKLRQFGGNLDRLQSTTRDEEELLGRGGEEQRALLAIRNDYDQFIDVLTRVIGLIRQRKIADARELHYTHATPLTLSLQLRMNELVNLADVSMMATINASQAAFRSSRWVVIGFALASILLALTLGYVISWSLIGSVREMRGRLEQISSGDFSQRVDVPNRDELGALAGNLNRMTEELGRLYGQLEAASRHKSQFLANMSHELRTPLNAVLGYTELIQDGIYGEVPQKVHDVLGRLQRNGRHLLGLINDVLDLSKIEAGQLPLSLSNYSMKDIVQSVVSATESLAAEKQLALRTSVQPDLPPGRGDERRITQVLMNLVGNAIKFTDAGEVRIQASAQDGEFRVAVADTGLGIGEADQHRIFEEFQQADGSGTRAKSGTGLGLSIARKIVELHGGRVWVESILGKGSTFWFTVPVRVDRQVQSS
jgi:signal transduction histidine kinase